MLAMSPTKRRRRQSESSFSAATESVMRNMQAAFAQLIASIPRPIAKAFDLQKVLRLDPKLASRVYRVAHAANPFSAGAEVPSRVSMQRLFKAASKEHVPATVIERASAAFDRFERLVAEHAGDRDSFASMVTALTGGVDGSEQIDLNQRRAVFKGNSHIWGLQTRAKIVCAISQPNGHDPALTDAVFLRGVVGLRQLRRDRPFTISTISVRDSDGVVRPPPEFDRLDVVDDQHGINLLRDFCTQPLPQIQNVVNDRGELVTQLFNADVGNSAAFTGFLCDVYRKADARYRTEHDRADGTICRIDSPFEAVIVDTLVRRGTFSDRPLTYSSKVISLVGQSELRPESADVLFTDAPAKYLGLGTDGLHTSDYPRYVEMINRVMDRLGWDPTDFEAYRYRLAYPVMNSAVVISCPLPERPKSD